jgi:hypothetical protein
MFNFALVAKILEVAGTSEKKVAELIENLAELVSHKFNTAFILFMNGKVTDQQLVEFAEFVENADNTNPEAVNKCIEWAKINLKDVDLSEFIDKFDLDMEELEMNIVNKLKKDLTDVQRKEVIDFLQTQIEVESEIWDDMEEFYSIQNSANANQGNQVNQVKEKKDEDLDTGIIF